MDRSSTLTQLFALLAACGARLRPLVAFPYWRWLLVPGSLWALSFYGRVLNHSYPVRDWLFWPYAYLWLAAAVFSLGCVSLGFATIRRLWGERLDWPVLETLLQSFVVGLVGFTLGMYGGGTLGIYGAPFAIALVLSMVGAGARQLLSYRRELRSAKAATAQRSVPISTYLSWGAGTACVALAYLQVMTPNAINYDGSWYHVPAAQDYAREGRIVPFYADYNRAFPHLATFVYAWGAMLPRLSAPLRWTLALHLEFLCFLWTLAGVAAAARWLLDDPKKPALWAAFFLFPAIFVYDHNMGGAADHVLAVFAAPCFLAVARALPRLDPRACLLVGVTFAGAVLTKYQAVYWIAGLGVLLLVAWLRILLGRRALVGAEARAASMRQLVIGPALLAATVLVLTLPHFVKNLIFYQNPFYPLAQTIFTDSYPQHPKSAFFMETIFAQPEHQLQGSLLERIKGALVLGLTCSFQPHYSFTRDTPMLGSLFVLLLPIALFAERKQRLWLGIIATYGATVTWAWTYVVDRYLQAVVPMMAAVTAALIVRGWQLGWPGRLALVPLVALQVVWGGDALFYSGTQRLTSAVNLINTGYERLAKTRFDHYFTGALAASRALPKQAQVLLHSERINLGFDRPITFDAPGMQGLVYYDDVAGSNALYELYRKLGVTHLAWRASARSEHSKQGEILFAMFVARDAKNRTTYGDFQVADMPAAAPPPDGPLRAVLLGTAYANGLYDVSQLTLQERVQPKRQTPFPKPLTRVKNDDTLGKVLEGVDVLVAAHQVPLHASGRRALKGFVEGMRYWGHVIYVRKRASSPPPPLVASPS